MTVYLSSGKLRDFTQYTGKKYRHTIIADCFQDVRQRVFACSQRSTIQNRADGSTVRLSLSLAIWRVVVFVNESCPCTSTPCTRLICSWLTEPGPPDTRETDETATTSPESLQNQIWKLFRAAVPGTVTSPGPRLLDEMGCTPCHVCACLRGESRLSWLGLNE